MAQSTRTNRAPIQKALQELLAQLKSPEAGLNLTEWFLDSPRPAGTYKWVKIDQGESWDILYLDFRVDGMIRVMQYPRSNVRNLDPLMTFNPEWRCIEYEVSGMMARYNVVDEEHVARGFYLKHTAGVANMIANRINNMHVESLVVTFGEEA